MLASESSTANGEHIFQVQSPVNKMFLAKSHRFQSLHEWKEDLNLKLHKQASPLLKSVKTSAQGNIKDQEKGSYRERGISITAPLYQGRALG